LVGRRHRGDLAICGAQQQQPARRRKVGLIHPGESISDGSDSSFPRVRRPSLRPEGQDRGLVFCLHKAPPQGRRDEHLPFDGANSSPHSAEGRCHGRSRLAPSGPTADGASACSWRAAKTILCGSLRFRVRTSVFGLRLGRWPQRADGPSVARG
jgi:hypothetical protein